jgi:hypothetical protein
MITDIRTCNICISRSTDGTMFYCAFCMSFICKRPLCRTQHDRACGEFLVEPLPAQMEKSA